MELPFLILTGLSALLWLGWTGYGYYRTLRGQPVPRRFSMGKWIFFGLFFLFWFLWNLFRDLP